MPLKTDINIWRRLMSSIQQTPIDIHADDLDELETQERLEALDAVLDRDDTERAHYPIACFLCLGSLLWVPVSFSASYCIFDYHPRGARARVPRRSRIRRAHSFLYPLECHGHGGQGK